MYYRVFVLVLLVLSGVELSAQGDNRTSLPIQVSLPSSANFNLAGANLRISYKQGKGTEQLITPSTVGTVWMNYSSVVNGSSTNAICASLSTGNLPPEVEIKLKVGPDAGFGYGATGRPVGLIKLTTYPQIIISNIGSCYTGQGINKGHPLTFTWNISPDYDEDVSIEDFDVEVGVIYTIISGE